MSDNLLSPDAIRAVVVSEYWKFGSTNRQIALIAAESLGIGGDDFRVGEIEAIVRTHLNPVNFVRMARDIAELASEEV